MHSIGSLLGLVIVGAIAYFVYQDAEKRGMNGVLWAALVFFFCIICLPLYLIMRKPIVIGGPPPAL